MVHSRWLWLLGALISIAVARGDAPMPSDPWDSPDAAVFPLPGSRVANPVVLTFRLDGLNRRFEPKELELRIDGRDATMRLLEMLARFPGELIDQDAETSELRLPILLGRGEHEVEFFWTPDRLARRTRFEVSESPSPIQRMEFGADLAPVDLEAPVLRWTVDDSPFTDRSFLPTGHPVFRSHWEEAEDLTARLRIDDVDVHSGALRSGDDIASESGLASGLHRFEVVAQDDHGNVSLERMAFTVFDPADRHPWPIPEATEPQTIGHLAHNFQHYGGRPYFHPGVDIRTPAESPVHSAVAGRVTELRYYGARPLYFEVAIQDDRGFLWEYHHIAEDSVPDAVREAFEKGQRVPAGTYLGSVIRWRVHAYGDRYDHLHLNVLDPWKNYLNPLRFLIAPSDDVPPRVAGLYFCPNEGERAFEVVRGTPVVSGDVDLVLEAEDLFGGAPFQLGVHEIRYQLVRVDARGKVPMGEPVLFCRFDSLPGGFDRHDGINSVFKRRLQVEDELLETEGNYSRRRFLYVLTHAPAGLVADKDSYWDTDGFRPDGEPLYPNGRYEVAVLAKDIFGNETRREFPVIVKNGSDAQSK